MQARNARDLGSLIRDRRRRLGLAQQELARRIGVSRQWVVEIEGGKPRAELELVLRALSVLGLELEVTAAQSRPPARAALLPTAGVDLDAVIERARDSTARPSENRDAAQKTRSRGLARRTRPPRGRVRRKQDRRV